jgi:hypothetical protein
LHNTHDRFTREVKKIYGYEVKAVSNIQSNASKEEVKIRDQPAENYT